MLTTEINQRLHGADINLNESSIEKQQLRSQLSNDIDAYLKNGGQIKTVGAGISANNMADLTGLRIGISFSQNTTVAPISRRQSAKPGKSGRTGIYELKSGKWRASIGRHQIGHFDTREEAEAAQNAAQGGTA